MEVLIAVSILSFVGVVLLKVVSNNNHFIAKFATSSTTQGLVSLVSDFKPDGNASLASKDLQSLNAQGQSFSKVDMKALVVKKYPKVSKTIIEALEANQANYLNKKISTLSLLGDAKSTQDDVLPMTDDIQDGLMQEALKALKVDVGQIILRIDYANPVDEESNGTLEYIYTIKETSPEQSLMGELAKRLEGS